MIYQIIEELKADPSKNAKIAILKQHVEAPVPDPRTLRDEDIPADLLFACEALLKKNPDNRPPNAAAAIELLDGKLPSHSPSFGTAEPGEPETRPPTPHTGGVANAFYSDAALEDDHALLSAQRSGTRTSLVIMLVTLTSIAAGLYFLPALMKQPEPPPPKPPTQQPAPEAHTFEAFLGQASKHLSENHPGKALTLIESALTQQPDNSRALLFQAQALLKLKRRKKAEKIVAALEKRDDLPADELGVLKSIREVIEIESGRKKRKKRKR